MTVPDPGGYGTICYVRGKSPKMKIVFMGTPAAAAVSLERLIAEGHQIVAVYTQPDRPSGRGNKIVFSPVKDLTVKNDVPLFQPSKIRNDEAVREFAQLDADIAVVVAYGRILPEGFLNAFPNGAVNLHFSLLPKYRGAAPVNWAIVNGEKVTGVTTIRMDAGLDTGDILMARETGIGEDENAPELMQRLAELGAEVLVETLANFDKIKPVFQDESAATYAPIMKREDGLIGWTRTAREISDRVRGFQPFPGSYTFIHGKRVVIWAAKPAGSDKCSSHPGGNLHLNEGDLLVGAGEGTVLAVSELQFEGKRRMSATEALNGGLIVLGGKFGQ